MTVRNDLIAIIFLASLPVVPAQAGQWLIYNNARYGTSADIPANGFSAEPSAQNGDGQTWVSADGRGRILVFGELVVTSATLPAYRQQILSYARSDGVDIVYNVAKKNWFVYSGFIGNDIVYEKVLVARGCDPMLAHHVYLKYPISQKKRYDSIVRRVAASLAGAPFSPMCN